MKTNGARNAIATAISTLCFAIEISSRFRRTAARRAPTDDRGRPGRSGHRGTAWCTHLRELSTITSVTANDTISSSIAIADA